MGNWVLLIKAGRANITMSTEWKSILSEEQRTHQVYVFYTDSYSSWTIPGRVTQTIVHLVF